MVVHIYNSSYLKGRDKEDHSLSLAPDEKWERSYQQNN
jgi:hypothetical protein